MPSLEIILLVLAAISVGVMGRSVNTSSYWELRNLVMAEEHEILLGQSQVLSPEEEKVNEILMHIKGVELDEAYHTLNFPPSQNFMTVKDQIDASDVFKLLQMMPKGSALHVHDTIMASIKWVVEEITYWPNLYFCEDAKGQLQMRFMETPNSFCNWTLLSDARASATTIEDFDSKLYERLSIITDNPHDAYPDQNSVWVAFEASLDALTGMVMWTPAWEAYMYHFLEDYSRDHVLYMELRGTLPLLYELDGRELSPVETLAVYEATSKRFVSDHPDTFYGVRFIYAPHRLVDNATVWEYVSILRELRNHFPDFVAGFDIVGQEDLGFPLKDFMEQLLTLSEEDIPVFYHAGETHWMGFDGDENLIDALLLNVTRIGHGFAITKHPLAKAMALEKDVPMEVNPISNQVLMLVDDLRNHPATTLIAEGFPIVISSDGGSSWGASPASHDFYEAFMALGGKKADLRFLKQLAINSISYSSLNEVRKAELMQMWERKWNVFIASVNALFNQTDSISTETSNDLSFSEFVSA